MRVAGAYFCMNMLLITLSSFVSVTVINVNSRADKRNAAPMWLKKVALAHTSAYEYFARDFS